ncbi:MAG TPA: formate/nitrite transporter family protein [Acidimicrobiales bacterium]|nr:formate/nitrite transporter family protein [Acidimicrobiales bacterium]
MTVSMPEALVDQAELATSKARLLRHSWPSYLLSSMLAGAFVGVAVLLMVMVSAAWIVSKGPVARLVEGSVFGVALALVVFAGAELWTGNAMTMVHGLMKRTASFGDTVAVLVGSIVGNLVGSIGFAVLVNASGVLHTGAAKGKPAVFVTAVAALVKSKAALTGGQLFFRSILCNMLVCLALWMAARTKSDAAKLIVLSWGLLAFVASGFEHSVANMTLFSLGALAHVGTWSELSRNLLWTIPGNLVGGGLIVGFSYGWLGRPVPAPAVAGAPTLTVDLGEPAPAAALVAAAPVATAPVGTASAPAAAAPAALVRRRRPKAAGAEAALGTSG